MTRPVAITAVGLLVGEGPGEISGFDARRQLPERKHLKLMSRATRLGVFAVGAALEARAGWEAVPSERRGLFVGCNPAAGSAGDLLPALVASQVQGRFDVAAFGELGTPAVPPLWLVKGLSNNIVGFASAYWDLQGVNGNRCEGRAGGLAAVLEGARAVAEGRADLVVAGGADSLLHARRWAHGKVGEGAAFFVIEPASVSPASPRVVGGALQTASAGPDREPADPRGELGAAAGPVRLADAIRCLSGPVTVAVADPLGLTVSVEVAPPA